ncbi:MAG: hypothetical protein QNJ22_01630 [Desulfosarcinaceae bacterium]|nr:hypothetical protein [Desulfosarcinaceae bacterium]
MGSDDVPTCVHHSDRATRYCCSKHAIYLCDACLVCRDPELFCKHRSACPIWFITRQQEKLGDGGAAGATNCRPARGPTELGPSADGGQ